VDEATYCQSVCGAKCCYLRLPDEPSPIPCPRLNPDNSCSVYAVRYAVGMPEVVVIGYFRSKTYRDLHGGEVRRPFPCGMIKDIAARGGLPKEVEEQCVVLHPELLDDLQDQ